MDDNPFSQFDREDDPKPLSVADVGAPTPKPLDPPEPSDDFRMKFSEATQILDHWTDVELTEEISKARAREAEYESRKVDEKALAPESNPFRAFDEPEPSPLVKEMFETQERVKRGIYDMLPTIREGGLFGRSTVTKEQSKQAAEQRLKTFEDDVKTARGTIKRLEPLEKDILSKGGKVPGLISGQLERARKFLSDKEKDKIVWEAIRDGRISGLEQTTVRAALDKGGKTVIDVTAVGMLKSYAIISTALNRTTNQSLMADQHWAYKYAEHVESAALKIFPGANDRGRQSDFITKFSGGAGSLVGFIGTGAMGAIVGAGPKGMAMIAAITGGSAMGSQQYTEAKEFIYRKAKEHYEKTGERPNWNEHEKTALKAAGWGFLLGLSEGVPLAGQFAAMRRAARTDLTIGQRVLGVTRESTKEGGQEGYQTLGENITAATYYDPTRSLTEGLGDAILIGGMLGGMLKGATIAGKDIGHYITKLNKLELTPDVEVRDDGVVTSTDPTGQKTDGAQEKGKQSRGVGDGETADIGPSPEVPPPREPNQADVTTAQLPREATEELAEIAKTEGIAEPSVSPEQAVAELTKVRDEGASFGPQYDPFLDRVLGITNEARKAEDNRLQSGPASAGQVGASSGESVSDGEVDSRAAGRAAASQQPEVIPDQRDVQTYLEANALALDEQADPTDRAEAEEVLKEIDATPGESFTSIADKAWQAMSRRRKSKPTEEQRSRQQERRSQAAETQDIPNLQSYLENQGSLQDFDAISEATGVPVDEVEGLLQAGVDQGLLREYQGDYYRAARQPIEEVAMAYKPVFDQDITDALELQGYYRFPDVVVNTILDGFSGTVGAIAASDHRLYQVVQVAEETDPKYIEVMFVTERNEQTPQAKLWKVGDQYRERFTVTLPKKLFFGTSAFFYRGDDSGNPAGIFSLRRHIAGDFMRATGAELYHEAVHSQRSAAGALAGDSAVWALLLGHAKSLNLLPKLTSRRKAQLVGEYDPDIYDPDTTFEEAYTTSYSEMYPDPVEFKEMYDQEHVAHMVELWAAGALTDQQVAPVLDILQAFEDGTLSDPLTIQEIELQAAFSPMLAISQQRSQWEQITETIGEDQFEITDKDGVVYRARRGAGAGALTYNVETTGGEAVGTFAVTFDNDHGAYVGNALVADEYQRRHIALKIYSKISDDLKSGGLDLQPSPDQTEAGRAFWDYRTKLADKLMAEMREHADSEMAFRRDPPVDPFTAREQFDTELDENGMALAIAAFHGSPHKFKKFDISRIGTGEGAQVFGHGLYFAENKRVAEYYSEAVAEMHSYSERGYRLGGDTNNSLVWDVREYVGDYADMVTKNADWWKSPEDKAKAKRVLKNAAKEDGQSAEFISLIDEVIDGTEAVESYVYKVTIDIDFDQLLDWDKPISEQSDSIRNALAGLPAQKELESQRKLVARMQAEMDEASNLPIASERLEATRKLSSDLLREKRKLELLEGRIDHHQWGTGSREVEALRKAGIPGIKYLDQQSREYDEGTYNYVIFDDSLITIDEINGTPTDPTDSRIGPVAAAISARHVSKQLFKAFDQDYIGTGEGAYLPEIADEGGRGFYFTQSDKLLARYRQNLADGGGYTYDVEIDVQENEVLDLDLELWDQNQEVQDKLADLGITADEDMQALPKTEEGREAMEHIGLFAVAFTELDGKMQPHQNFTVYDPARITIKKVNGQDVSKETSKRMAGPFAAAVSNQVPRKPKPTSLQQNRIDTISAAVNLPNPKGYKHQDHIIGINRILRNLQTNLDMPLRQGRGLGRFLGYNPETGMTRQRIFYQINDLAQNIGDVLFARYPSLRTAMQNHATEIERLDPTGNDEFDAGFQAFMDGYINNPSSISASAPTALRAFNTAMDQISPENLAALQEAQRRIEEFYRADPTAKLETMIVPPDKSRPLVESLNELDPKGVFSGLYLRFRMLTRGLLDKHNPFHLANKFLLQLHQEQTGERLDLKVAENAEKLLRLAPMSYAWAGQDLEQGVRSRNANEHEGASVVEALRVALGDSRAEAIDMTESGRYRKFGAYLLARRAVGLWQNYYDDVMAGSPRGLRPPVQEAAHPGVLNQAIAQYEQDFPTFARAADMVYDYQRQLLRLQHEAGLISDAVYAELLTHKDYVPFLRSFEERSMVSSRAMDRNSIIKRFRGSQRDIIDPIASIAQKTYETRQIIAVNDAKLALLRLAERIGVGGALIAERLDAQQTEVARKNINAQLMSAANQLGVDPNDRSTLAAMAQQMLGNDAMYNEYSRTQAQFGNEPVVWVFENGEAVPIRLGDQWLGRTMYETLQQLGVETTDVMLKLAQVPSSFVRGTVTAHPEFIAANIIRDGPLSFMYDWRMIPIWDQIRGFFVSVADGKSAQEYAANAGLMGGPQTSALDKVRLDRDMQTLIDRGYKPNLWSSPQDFFQSWRHHLGLDTMHGMLFAGAFAGAGAVMGGPLWAAGGLGLAALTTAKGRQAMAKFTEASETGTRIRLYQIANKRALAHNLDAREAALEAAFHAQDYMDYSRSGSKTAGMMKVTAFFNAALVGLNRGYRLAIAEGDYGSAFKHYFAYMAGHGAPPTQREVFQMRQAAVTWATMTFAFGAISALLAQWNEEDEDAIKDIAQPIRDKHWIISLGGVLHFIPKEWPGLREWYQRNLRDKQVRIPKPFEMAWFANSVEHGLHNWKENDPRGFENWMWSMWEIMHPPLEPQFAAIGTGLWSGKDSFTGRDIIPVFDSGSTRDKLYGPYTSEFAKWFGPKVDVAPYYVDWGLKALGTSWARDALKVSGKDNATEWGVDDMWILRRFMWAKGRGSEAKSALYDTMRGDSAIKSINDRLFPPYSRLAASARSFGNQFKGTSYEVKDEQAALDWLAARTPRERGYALLTQLGEKSKYKMLDPMYRAKTSMQVVNGMMKNIHVDDLKIGAREEKLVLSPSDKRMVRDILTQYQALTAANALIVTGETGWAQKATKNTNVLMQELAAANPRVHKELKRRLDKKKILPFASVAKSWPKVAEFLQGNDAMSMIRLGRVSMFQGKLGVFYARARANR